MGLLDGMSDFFNASDNCDETFLLAYHKRTVASIYIGPGLGKPTVASALQAVAGQVQPLGDSMTNRTVAQICGGGRGPATVFGISINTTGDLAGVQRTALSWSHGDCAAAGTDQKTLDVKIYDIASVPLTTTNGRNGSTIATPAANNTSSLLTRALNRRSNHPRLTRDSLNKRATCSYIRVEDGDGCASLAVKCEILGLDFEKYNPDPLLCSTLQIGDYVCCSAGDPYTDPKPDPPQENPDGTCATHLIQDTDTCDKLGKAYGLTENDIESFNAGKTWGWTECKAMMFGYNICLSTGASPLPPPQQGVQCGPQVPGTERTDMSTPMNELNPCPLKACCSSWGYCGPFSKHCDIHAPPG
ncbi:hypothetical protein IMZ48_45715, partial [Candidatus Bathyarchaeota archaeon]|nr:hypothetical protein [Candidatus Bathyarchaeota archaeon]